MTGRPNVLFIFSDQQSASMMSCAGNPYMHTPAMDSLAATGVRFDRAYCTNPVCVPSRFSLMTGRMPSEIGLCWNGPLGVNPIPDRILQSGAGWLLRSAGYDVAYGGKEHLPKMTSRDLGFDFICEDARDALIEACVEFVQRKRDKPFFLVASFVNPHDICYMALRDFKEREGTPTGQMQDSPEYQALDEALQLPDGVTPEEFFDKHCPPLPDNHEPQDDEPEAIRDILSRREFRRSTRENYTEERWRLHRWAYCRLTERVDSQLARVLEGLQESGQYENTVIIFSSDHGDMDAAHRMEHKTALYEEACRVPLVISQPGVTSAGVRSDLVSTGLDLLPTLCDYAGIDPPDDLIGHSLRPLADVESQLNRSFVPVECQVGRMVVTREHKYVLYDEGAHHEQLMNIKDDPGETENHAGKPECRDILEKHRRLFSEHFDSA